MAIKMAEGWILDPHQESETVLTRCVEILSYVVEHAAEEPTETREKHVARLLRAIAGIVEAAGRSPSSRIRERVERLREFLLRFEALNRLIATAYGGVGSLPPLRLAEALPDLVSDETGPRFRGASSSGTGRRW